MVIGDCIRISSLAKNLKVREEGLPTVLSAPLSVASPFVTAFNLRQFSQWRGREHTVELAE